MNRCTVMSTCALVLLLGCEHRDLKPITPNVSRIFEVGVNGSGVGDVDLLFVIDDSNSMREEQESLRREIPRLVEGLTSPPTDEMGRPMWNAVESLRVAIVTTNMGSAGHPETARLPAICSMNDFRGDDGALREDAACASGRVFDWYEGQDAAAFSAEVACVADVGIAGCGLEQPLLAAGRALNSSAEVPREFPRAEALLAVVVLSDEEDCSLADPAGFFSGDEVGPQLNQRCSRNPEFLVGVEAMMESIRGERTDDRFLFAALVGVPRDLESADLDTILADPRMAYQYTEENALGLVPACTRTAGGVEVGQASPGRRYVQLAQRFSGSLIRSICAESFQPAIAELTARIGGRIDGVCANRALTPDEDGAVECVVRETLPPGMACDELPGRDRYGTTPEGRNVCNVVQAVRGVAAGWRYDVENPECEQVAYIPEAAVPPRGTSVELECLVEVEVPIDPENPVGP